MRRAPPLHEMIAGLVAIPSVSSVSPELDMGNRALVELLAGWLHDLGFTVTLQALPDQPDKANLIARIGPDADDGLVLAGHTDTVPYDEHLWRSDPFTLTECEGRLYGLGVADMKAFLALAIEAARPLVRSGLRRPLTLLATADEESSMAGAQHLLDLGERPGRHCLIGEPTNLVPVRQHKGILMEAIRLRGQSGHSSDPRLGNNALEGMHAVIHALLELRAEWQACHHNSAFAVPVPTMNLGHIHGGDNPNRICGECELHIDLRPLPGMALDALRDEIHARVAKTAQALALEWTCRPLFTGIPAMETPADAHIVRLAEQLAGHDSTAVAFGTEGPYFNRLGAETVILGPGDIAQAHQPNEYLDSARLAPMVDIMSRMIRAVCSAEPASPPRHR